MIAWISPEGEVFELPALHLHGEWAQKEQGTNAYELMREGWIQLVEDSLRGMAPMRGAALRTAQDCLWGFYPDAIFITLIYGGHRSEFEIDSESLRRRRVIRHPKPQS